MENMETMSNGYQNVECADRFVGIGQGTMDEKGRVSFPKQSLALMNGKSFRAGDCFSVFTVEGNDIVYLCQQASPENNKLPPQAQIHPDIEIDNQGRISINRSLRNILGVIPGKKTTVFFTGEGDYCSISCNPKQKTKLDSSIKVGLLARENVNNDGIQDTRVEIRNATFKVVEEGVRPRVEFNIVLTVQGSFTISGGASES